MLQYVSGRDWFRGTLEDSPPGVAAARTAGLYVVGVPSVPGIVLEADLVVESLEDPRVPITIGERLVRP